MTDAARKFILVTVQDGEIELDSFGSSEEAREALMRDIYEMGQDTDLPENDSDEAVSNWINENELDFIWTIKEMML